MFKLKKTKIDISSRYPIGYFLGKIITCGVGRFKFIKFEDGLYTKSEVDHFNRQTSFCYKHEDIINSMKKDGWKLVN